MAEAAPAAGTPQPSAQPTNVAAPQPGETKAEARARIKLDLGEGEQEYDPEHVKGLAQRGRKAAQTLSLAEKRAQDAAKREEEVKGFRSRFESKDAKQIRAALKELGVDERMLANDVGRDLIEELDLSPEQKKVRTLEQQLRQRDEEAEKGKQSERQKAEEAETQRHTEELSNLFTEVMEKSGLPRESAAAVFPRLAQLYAAVEGSGGQVDADLAAERIKATLTAEHRALYYKPDGKGGHALNIPAIKSMLGPEAFGELRRAAVQEYRAAKAGGQVAPPVVAKRSTDPEPERPAARGSFWKDFDRRAKG